MCRREPRKGRRLTIAATIATPGGPLLVYSAHLEVFSGPIGRLRQFADILDHSRAAAARGVSRHIIGGDLNTMAHGIARFSPYHCTDHLRWATLGQCEAAFWQHHVFDVQGDTSLPADQVRRLPPCHGSVHPPMPQHPAVNPRAVPPVTPQNLLPASYPAAAAPSALLSALLAVASSRRRCCRAVICAAGPFHLLTWVVYSWMFTGAGDGGPRGCRWPRNPRRDNSGAYHCVCEHVGAPLA